MGLTYNQLGEDVATYHDFPAGLTYDQLGSVMWPGVSFSQTSGFAESSTIDMQAAVSLGATATATTGNTMTMPAGIAMPAVAGCQAGNTVDFANAMALAALADYAMLGGLILEDAVGIGGPTMGYADAQVPFWDDQTPPASGWNAASDSSSPWTPQSPQGSTWSKKVWN